MTFLAEIKQVNIYNMSLLLDKKRYESDKTTQFIYCQQKILIQESVVELDIDKTRKTVY